MISYIRRFFGYNTNNYNEVPVVQNSWPIIGHILNFQSDAVKFIKNCYDKYGKIFAINMFGRKFVVVCDQSLTKEFFSAKEDAMSLYDVLDKLYFSEAFTDKRDHFNEIIKTVKKTISLDIETFGPKIESEADIMINRLHDLTSKSKIDLIDETIRFVSHTSARCFLGKSLSQKAYEKLMEFTNLLNKIVVMTYFVPRSLIRFIYGSQLRRLRTDILSEFEEEIIKYITNLNYNESHMIRRCVDENMSVKEIGEIIVCLLYVSSENSSLCLNASIIDAVKHRFWNEIRNIKFTNYENLFNNELLDNCIAESCRLNSHIFALNRKPKTKNTLGNYYIGDSDNVVLCEPMLMIYATSDFKNPHIYNPDRFTDKTLCKESKLTSKIITFGDGIHLCPGRKFALWEIKMALYKISQAFNIEFLSIPKINYFSPSAFAEIHVDVKITSNKKTLSQ